MAVFYDVKIKMRDGVELSADVYLPDSGGPHPVVLHRTPYNNNAKWTVAEARFFASHGYAYVAQDCRGKFDSGGEWYPYRHETSDGDDTLTWCGTQPWSNGRVGMTGASYSGTAQWYAASTGNPHLKCIAPASAFSDLFFDHGLRRDGALQPYFIHWSVAMAGRAVFDIERERIEDALVHAPLAELDRLLGFDLPYWKDFVSHESYDDFWRGLSLRDKYGSMGVAALNLAGWHSPWELQGALTHFRGMTGGALTAEARRSQRLVVGPWTHFINYSKRVGEYDFGEQAIIDLQGLQLRWFGRWLKGEGEGEGAGDGETPVRIFVMGENRWRDESAWPPERTRPTPFYLHSGGHANGLGGDGRLDARPPEDDEPADQYVYNPRRPVHAPFSEQSPEEDLYADRRQIERRDDVLVYTTEPLARDVEVTGPVAVKLHAATSALDTDFVASLVDVHPDGLARPLTWGVARGRYLGGFADPRPLEPYRVYEWTIDLWATSNVFLAGHRIRLEVSSSFFPFFGRNHNTGRPAAADTEFVVAEQTVHHTRARPSHVSLPLVPRAEDGPREDRPAAGGDGEAPAGP